MKDMGVTYLHVFPTKMPPKFFDELDKTNMLDGQDTGIWAYEEDFLFEPFSGQTRKDIKAAIDHVYKEGRPEAGSYFPSAMNFRRIVVGHIPSP